MRLLLEEEIKLLENQHCSADNRENIQVSDDFTPQYIMHTHFSGNVKLGVFKSEITLSSGLKLHSGISFATIHECTIDDDVYINAISGCISNYHIHKNCYIDNVYQLVVEGESSFGNGTQVCVLNEAGGREVKIFDSLSSHLAYVLALYRHRQPLIASINRLIDTYVISQTSSKGEIGQGTKIINSGIIKNVKIGECCSILNVPELFDGTILSDAESPTNIATGVVARHFIVGKGSHLYDYALVEKCFVGESCEIAKQYSAIDSLFFSNSQVFHGEATAVFAGPYTTTHHKSTLLIGCMFSFYNAGSGTNQSNHMYKLGPVHQGVFERGVKTGSDSYVMLETKVGAYSLLLGHHEQHFDTSDFPFSYILENNGRSVLIPAVNFQTVGTQRDVQKWIKRDKRNKNHQDYIVFDLLTPYSIQKIQNGIEILNKFNDKNSEFHSHKGIKIKNIFVSKGIEIYRSIIDCYIGQKITEKILQKDFSIEQFKSTIAASDTWVDFSGLIAPASALENLFSKIENNTIKDIKLIKDDFCAIYNNYETFEWAFFVHLLEQKTGKNIQSIIKDDLINILEIYHQKYTDLIASVFSDAEKEFNQTAMVSFGIDGDDNVKQADFINVRGSIDSNAFILSLKEKEKNELKKMKECIAFLNKI
jgi:hypothetical protein